jgi:hypothetical protein
MTFTAETRARALEVLGDTDTWTGSDWQHAAIQLASAIVAVAGDLEKIDLPRRRRVAEQTADMLGQRAFGRKP